MQCLFNLANGGRGATACSLDELRGHALLIFEQCLENMDWRDALMAHADGNCLGAL